MSDDSDSGAPLPLAVPVEEKNWKLRLILAGIVVVVAAIGVFIAITIVPRWWSHRVGDLVDGSITKGTFFGLLIGFVFTFAALVLIRQLFREIPWRLRVVVVVAALVVASPNLMTLGIVLGDGKAAHAGDRVLDVEAPAYRTASAWGAVIALLVAIALVIWVWRWRRERRRTASES